MKYMKLFIQSAVTLGIFVTMQTPALAEKADSKKELLIDSGKFFMDKKSSSTKLSNGVLITRGTLNIEANQADLSDLSDGGKLVVMSGASGKPITFKQKRDGGPDLWVEGSAEKAEYNDSTEVIKFLANARVRFLNGSKVTEEFNGEFLSYDSREERIIGANSKDGSHKDGAGKIRIVIHPKTEN